MFYEISSLKLLVDQQILQQYILLEKKQLHLAVRIQHQFMGSA